MPETRLKTLYMAKSFGDLQKKTNVPFTNAKARMLVQTAEKLFLSAEQAKRAGDEELSYILFMRYLGIVTYIQKSDECKKDPKFFNLQLGSVKVNIALDNAEKLSQSLSERYKLLKEQEKMDKLLIEQEIKDAEEEENNRKLEEIKNKKGIPNGIPEDDDQSICISSKQLYRLILDGQKNILVLDVRPEADYKASHMTLGNCINVPEEIVKPGTSAAGIEKELQHEAKEKWKIRQTFDLLVLFDWRTRKETFSTTSKVFLLKNILLKWDPGIIYKREPLLLEGGYEDWLLTYPPYSSNPNVISPFGDNGPCLDDLLNDIEYPVLNENTNDESSLLSAMQRIEQSQYPDISSLVHTPSVNRSIKPRTSISEDHFSSSDMANHFGSDGDNNRSSNYMPVVDRSLKAKAVLTYEERAKAIEDILKAKEVVADNSVELERQRLNAEKDWEILRIEKEKEAEEEMRMQLQEKEEELIRKIIDLQEKQQQKDKENELLKKELEEYRNKELAQSKTPPTPEKNLVIEERRLQDIIKTKEEERKKIEKERETIMNNRKNKDQRQEMERIQKERQEEQRKKREIEEVRQRQEQRIGEGTYYTKLRADLADTGTGMKRSHSSPNIAQMDDIDIGLKHKTPQFDRAIKPLNKAQPVRQRNFYPVYGTLGRGLTGLKNLGNTCYMNSIIQCLNSTTSLAFYFCSGNYKDDVNRNNKVTHGEVAEEVGAVIRALWSGQYRSIACIDLKRVVGQYHKSFQGYEQQDSHEFLTELINWLNDDLCKVSQKSASVDSFSSNNKDEIAAEKAWREFTNSKESLILTLFYGLQRSKVTCQDCRNESVTFELISHLSLPLPNNNKCSLNDCMTMYLNGEKISGYNCPECKTSRIAIKKFDIWKLPPILIIHLSRFYNDSSWWRKRQIFVDFPIRDFNMKPFTVVPSQRYTNFNLYGVSNHYGTMEGGHYTAYCKSSTLNSWYRFDDTDVSEISLGDVKSTAAYILFYTSVDCNVPKIIN